MLASLLVVTAPAIVAGQGVRVLALDPQDAFGGALPVDRGASGVRQRLLELRTTASVLQTTAHPDDEQSGLLTYLSRGTGARTALLTLNRGEAGANAVGSELFDALGLLRNEELLLASRYYGLDDQYFTSAVDYGYSKMAGEAARSWDTTAVLADMVRIIRENQPLVVVSRWYGGERDGHGHHQMAGILTPLAVAAAADPARFPEQLTDGGLRPWRARRLLRANVRAGEPTDVVIDAGRYDPWLGESYQSMGADGLSRQRSQTAGRRAMSDAAAPQRLQQVYGPPIATHGDLFSGLDTTLPGMFTLLEEGAPRGVRALLDSADHASARALATLDPQAPWRIVPMLVTGLRAIRAARERVGSRAPHAARMLDIKERQFERTLVAAAAVQLRALAGAGNGDGRPVVPGDTVPVQLTVSVGSPLPVSVERVAVLTRRPWPTVLPDTPTGAVVAGAPWSARSSVVVPADAPPTRPAFFRRGIDENRYRWREGTPSYDGRGDDPVRVHVVVRLGGDTVALDRAVRYRRSDEPDGVAYPRLVVLPKLSLRAAPSVVVVTDTGAVTRRVTVEVVGQGTTPIDASIGLEQSGGGARTPTQSVRVPPGARVAVTFDVPLPSGVDSLALVAVARAGDRVWRDEVSVIQHRELETAYLYAEPLVRVRRIPVSIAAGLRVAYIMGVGDLVPDAIAQLGASVTLLDAAAVTAGDFGRFDALVIGTRAYAVRPELAAATPSLVSYARGGGTVVVLYQTQEFKPETMAPYRALLPNNAEETSEEDAEVQLLAPSHPQLSSPNRITAADFDGWIEQRGSKFLTQLAPEYTALVETHDTAQEPQRGVWVSAQVGEGRWSYVALALHRQLPYAVPGAFRILANLLTPARGK